MISEDVPLELEISRAARSGPPLRTWVAFGLLATLIYVAAYSFAEAIVYRYGEKSRLFMIATAPQEHYDVVILGASHAMPFSYDAMNERLEQATGASILNLSIEGGGIVPAEFNLDYFLARHSVSHVIYVLDSFAFYSREWNEVRIRDASLLKRAPFDFALLKNLWRYPSTRDLIAGYVSGFYKINDASRFKADRADKDGPAFEKTYRANVLIDRQRLKYLYPAQIDAALVAEYLGRLDALAASLKSKGINFVVVRPPLPNRVLARVEGEAAFNQRVQQVLARYQFELHDASEVAIDDAFFFDTDHLNRSGVSRFYDDYFVPLIKALAR